MYPMKLAPAYKDYLWGGHELERLFGKAGDGDCTAESWELSCHPDGKSTVRNGAFKGKTLEEVLDQFPEYVSHKFQPEDKFPIFLYRFIRRMRRQRVSWASRGKPRCGMYLPQNRMPFCIMG